MKAHLSGAYAPTVATVARLPLTTDDAWVIADHGAVVIHDGLDEFEQRWVTAIATELAALAGPTKLDLGISDLPQLLLKLATVKAARRLISADALGRVLRSTSSGYVAAGMLGVPYVALLTRWRFQDATDAQLLRDTPPLRAVPDAQDIRRYSVRVVHLDPRPDAVVDLGVAHMAASEVSACADDVVRQQNVLANIVEAWT